MIFSSKPSKSYQFRWFFQNFIKNLKNYFINFFLGSTAPDQQGVVDAGQAPEATWDTVEEKLQKASKMNEMLLKTINVSPVSMIFSKLRPNFIVFAKIFQILIFY